MLRALVGYLAGFISCLFIMGAVFRGGITDIAICIIYAIVLLICCLVFAYKHHKKKQQEYYKKLHQI